MINTTVPTTEKFQLKPESWGCVLCKDCKWRGQLRSGGYYCNNDLTPVVMMLPDNFGCVLGERNPIEDDEELAERLR